MKPTCRHCQTPLSHSLVDLGTSPPCNNLVSAEQLNQPETYYPLHTMVCENCFLVQVGDSVTPDEIFTEYSYFSSFSDSWVEHARLYVESVVARFDLDENNQVFEVASNDGYLLQHFLPKQIPVLGIEPAQNVAAAAIEKGINTISVFLGSETAAKIVAEHGNADLVIANNVMAHTPYLNDFVKGLSILIKPSGVITVEFPHLLRLMQLNQFDTIYHEHFSYFSLLTVKQIFESYGLRVFDVEQLTTHGGSLRIYATQADAHHTETPAVNSILQEENHHNLNQISGYLDFTSKVQKVKRDLLAFLIQAKEDGKSVVGYGAPGKGNTLLNYCGIRTDLLEYVVDRNPYKQNNYTPGMRIPIYGPEKIEQTKPDYVLVLVWNLIDEICTQMSAISQWGGQFVVAIPELKVIPAAD